jgi:hypothetical protein
MHNRTLVVWFGMVLSGSLLGCPPAAKSAKDSQEPAAAGAPEGQAQGDASGSDKKEQEKSAPPAPAPSGGW